MKTPKKCDRCDTKCNFCPVFSSLKAAIALNESIYRWKAKDEQPKAIAQLLPGQMN
jgi:hypothetical protein